MIIQNEVKKALDALSLDYYEGGDYFQLSCPFAATTHGKNSNNASGSGRSFVVYPTRDLVKCFSCKYCSSLYDFFCRFTDLHNIDIDFEYLEFYLPQPEPEAVINIHLNPAILGAFTKSSLTDGYLKSRGIDPKYLPYDVLFHSKHKQIVLPIWDDENNLLGATGRNIHGRGHYHYFGVVTSKCLLGLENTSASKILVVEGLTDKINTDAKIKELGLDFDVYATLTCSLSQWQAQKLIDLQKPLYWGWDCDEAGLNGRKKVEPLISDALFTYNCTWDNPALDFGNMNCNQVQKVLTQ